MSEREILFNMGLASAVFAGVIFVFLVGGLFAVIAATVAVHVTVRRIEAERQGIAIRTDDDQRR